MKILPPTPPGEAEYEAIEGWIMAIANGRWFLAEYAGRHRREDTAKLLTAISRIEQVARGANNIRVNLVALHDAIIRVQGAIGRTKLSSDPQLSADGLKAAARDLEAKIAELVMILGRDMTSPEHLLAAHTGSSPAKPSMALATSSEQSAGRTGGWGNASGDQDHVSDGSQHPPAAMEDLISKACHWLHAVTESAPNVGQEAQHVG